MAPVVAILAAAVPLVIVAAALFGMPGILIGTGIAIPMIVVAVQRSRRAAQGRDIDVEKGAAGVPGVGGEAIAPEDVPLDLRDQWSNRGFGIGDWTQTDSDAPYEGLPEEKRQGAPEGPPRTTGR